MEETQCCVKVALNIRPILTGDGEHATAVLRAELDKPHVHLGQQVFDFDHVYGEGATPASRLYPQCISPLVDSLFMGYNATIFAYGQTGSGKTYTMGSGSQSDGIIAGVVADLFSRMASIPEREFIVRAKFVELYNEQFRDLLAKPQHSKAAAASPAGTCLPHLKKSLEKRLDDPILVGSEHMVSNQEELRALLEHGVKRRVVAENGTHHMSSRSHAIFTISVEQRLRLPDLELAEGPATGDSNQQGGTGGGSGCLEDVQPGAAADQQQQGSGSSSQGSTPSSVASAVVATAGFAGPGAAEMLLAKMHLVDLAGSEEFKGHNLKETRHINQSLLTLNRVVEALAHKEKFAPFRQSKLTRLLQDSLGGNSRTLFIACVSPADTCRMATLSTLWYTKRARSIKNTPRVNRKPLAEQIGELQQELDKMQQVNAALYEEVMLLRQGAANGMLLQGGPPGPGSDAWSEDQQQSPNQEAYDELVVRYERVSAELQQKINAAEVREEALQRQLDQSGQELKQQWEQSEQQVVQWHQQFDAMQVQLADAERKLEQQQEAANQQCAAASAAVAAAEGRYEVQMQELQQQWQQEKEQLVQQRLELTALLAEQQVAREVEFEQRAQQTLQWELERELLLQQVALKEGAFTKEHQLRMSLKQQLEELQQRLMEKEDQLDQQQQMAAAAAQQAAAEQQRLEQQLQSERVLQAQLAADTAAELAHLREEQEKVLAEQERLAAEAFQQAHGRHEASVKHLEGVVAAEGPKLEAQMRRNKAKEEQVNELLQQIQQMAAAAEESTSMKHELEAEVGVLQQQLAQHEEQLIEAVQTVQSLQAEVQAKSAAAQEAREGLQAAAQAGEALRQLCASLEAMVWGHAQGQAAAERKLKKMKTRVGASDMGKLGAALSEVRAMQQECEDLKQQLQTGHLIAPADHSLEVQQQQLLLQQAQGQVEADAGAVSGGVTHQMDAAEAQTCPGAEDTEQQEEVGGHGAAEGDDLEQDQQPSRGDLQQCSSRRSAGAACQGLQEEEQQQQGQCRIAGAGGAQPPNASSSSMMERGSLHAAVRAAWEDYQRTYPQHCTPANSGKSDASGSTAVAATGSNENAEIVPAEEADEVQGVSVSGIVPAPAAFVALGRGYSKADADQLCTAVSMEQRITQMEARLAELMQNAYNSSSACSNASDSSGCSSSFTGVSAGPPAAAAAAPGFGTPRKSRFAAAGDACSARGVGALQGSAGSQQLQIYHQQQQEAEGQQRTPDTAGGSTEGKQLQWEGLGAEPATCKSPVPPLDLCLVHAAADPSLAGSKSAKELVTCPPACAVASPMTPGSSKVGSFLSRLKMNWATPKASPRGGKVLGKSASSAGGALSHVDSAPVLTAANSMPASVSRGWGGSFTTCREPGIGGTLAAAADAAAAAGGRQKADSSARSTSSGSMLARDSRGGSELELSTATAAVATPAPAMAGSNSSSKLGMLGGLVKRPGPQQQQQSAPDGQVGHGSGRLRPAAAAVGGVGTWPITYRNNCTQEEELLVLQVLGVAVTKKSLQQFLSTKSLGGESWKERKKPRAAMMQDLLRWYASNQQHAEQGVGAAASMHVQEPQGRALPGSVGAHQGKLQQHEQHFVLKSDQADVDYRGEEIMVTEGSSSSTSSSSRNSSRVRELGTSSSLGSSMEAKGELDTVDTGGLPMSSPRPGDGVESGLVVAPMYQECELVDVGRSSGAGCSLMGHSGSSEQHGAQSTIQSIIDLTVDDGDASDLAEGVRNSRRVEAAATGAFGGDDVRGSVDSSSNGRSTFDQLELAGYLSAETPPLKLAIASQYRALGQENAQGCQSSDWLLQQAVLGNGLGGSAQATSGLQQAYRMMELQRRVRDEGRR